MRWNRTIGRLDGPAGKISSGIRREGRRLGRSREEIEKFGEDANSFPPMAKGIPTKGDDTAAATFNSSSPEEKEKTHPAPDPIRGKSKNNRKGR